MKFENKKTIYILLENLENLVYIFAIQNLLQTFKLNLKNFFLNHFNVQCLYCESFSLDKFEKNE